jgi:hypothetical protein
MHRFRFRRYFYSNPLQSRRWVAADVEKLKAARSQAELHAIKQRNIQIILTITNVCVTILIALKTFGII